MDDDTLRKDPPERTAADLIAEIKAESPPPKESPDAPPQQFPRLKSAYEILCEELGDPADIGINVSKKSLARCCNEYRLADVLPVLLQFNDDKTSARRHWPWAAFAIDQYAYEVDVWKSYSNDNPTPQEIEELLSGIAKSAHNLTSGLVRLQALSRRLKDQSAPRRPGHLEWLHAFIIQGAAGLPSNDVNESPEHMLVVELANLELLKLLAQLEATTKRAKERVDPTLLRRVKSESNPASYKFVFRCGRIWKSPTGRKASANKVAAGNPDFVVFVGLLAKIGNAPAPSRDQVHLSLRKQM